MGGGETNQLLKINFNSYLVQYFDYFRICLEALEYYLSLSSEKHKDSWTNLLLLLMSRVTELDDEKVYQFFFFS